MKRLMVVIVLAIPLFFAGIRTGVGEERDSETYRTLLDLLTERQRQVAVYGDTHPKIDMLDKKIESIKDSLKNGKNGKSARPITPSVDVEAMSDAELRTLVQLLVGRVTKLENEIVALKELQKPRFELLDK